MQASVPRLIKRNHGGCGPDGDTAKTWAFILAGIPALIATGLYMDSQSGIVLTKIILLGGLIIFGIVFAVNSAVHSYLIVS